PLKHLELRLCHCGSSRLVLIGERSVRNEIFGPIVLKFNAIGTCIGSSVDGSMGQFKVAVVVDTNLGSNEAGLALTHHSLIYVYDFHAFCCKNSTTRLAPRPSTSCCPAWLIE